MARHTTVLVVYDPLFVIPTLVQHNGRDVIKETDGFIRDLLLVFCQY